MADLCLDSMSINVCCHIYNFEFVYENINSFLSNDRIWNYQNLNSHISQTHFDILFKFSGFSMLIGYYKVIETESQTYKGFKIFIFLSRPIVSSILLKGFQKLQITSQFSSCFCPF